jgi:hypothetical protein
MPNNRTWKNWFRKSIGLPRQKKQNKPEHVENAVKPADPVITSPAPFSNNNFKNVVSRKHPPPRYTIPNAPSTSSLKPTIPRPRRPPVSILKKGNKTNVKKTVRLSNTNSEGNPIKNNKKNTRKTVYSRTINNPDILANGVFNLSRATHLVPKNKNNQKVKETNIVAAMEEQQQNTSPANRFYKRNRMPNARIENLIAARKGYYPGLNTAEQKQKIMSLNSIYEKLRYQNNNGNTRNYKIQKIDKEFVDDLLNTMETLDVLSNTNTYASEENQGILINIITKDYPLGKKFDLKNLSQPEQFILTNIFTLSCDRRMPNKCEIASIKLDALSKLSPDNLNKIDVESLLRNHSIIELLESGLDEKQIRAILTS